MKLVWNTRNRDRDMGAAMRMVIQPMSMILGYPRADVLQKFRCAFLFARHCKKLHYNVIEIFQTQWPISSSDD